MKTQRELQQAHGTPKEFADAVWNAIGEISVAEAQEAIRKYEAEWFEAGLRGAGDWELCPFQPYRQKERVA